MEKTKTKQENNRRFLAFKKRIPVYRKQPVLFFKEILNFKPDEWQDNVATDIAGHRRVSVRSGQGVGKTALEAAVALWFLSGSSLASRSPAWSAQLRHASN